MDPAQALPAGPAAVALMAWRYRGALRITVIAKATFSIACDTAMPRTRPQPIVGAEVHHGKNPTRSIRLTTDLVPYLERADVFFTGSAYAPPGDAPEAMHVRLGVFQGAQKLLDKALLVRQKGGFREIPIVYERSFGGIGQPDNPLGVGVPAGSGEPNVLDPEDPQRAAGFGPIGQAWPARRRLGGDTRKALAAPIPTIPESLSWEYFQAAPPDQRIAYLAGDEWIVMDGLHPTLAMARTRLPGARGLARVYGLSGHGVVEGQRLQLHADMLRIDGDDRQVTVTFRGVFPVADEAALASVRVVAGVELPGEPIPWPEDIALKRASAVAAPPQEQQPEVSTGATITLNDDDFISQAPETQALPELVAAAEPPGRAATVVLTDPAFLAPVRSAYGATAAMPAMPAADPLPFVAAAGASPFAVSAAPARYRDEHPWSGTLASGPDDFDAVLRPVVPFAGAAVAPPPPVAKPAFVEREMAPTAPPPVAAAPTPPPPRAVTSPPVDTSPQREVTVSVAEPARTQVQPVAKPAPVLTPTASPALKKGLYGKFAGNR